MKTTLVGIIKIDPKKLLEDGIRKELVNQVASSLHKGLIFSPKLKPGELVEKLKVLGANMDAFRRSFEYIQDYVSIYGLKIWQEEVSRIINYNIEQECNKFLRTKVLDWQSYYQSTAVPIPNFAPVDNSVNFVGRLAREIQRISDPKTTVFVEQMNAWYDSRTKEEVLNTTIFALVRNSIGTPGLLGLDKLLSFMLVKELQNFVAFLTKNLYKDANVVKMVSELAKTISPLKQLLSNPVRTYANVTSKLLKHIASYSDAVVKVGQLQIIRRKISNELTFSCKFDSKPLFNAVKTFDEVVMRDIQAHYKDPSLPYPAEDNSLLYELTSYLEAIGLGNPCLKIYITANKHPLFPLFAALTVIGQISKLSFQKSLNG